jgi:hypothetical protein
MTKPPKNEHPAELELWIRNGFYVPSKARFATNMSVSIGLTDSERGLGFVVSDKKQKQSMEFVIDKDQAMDLIAYLQHFSLPRLRKPIGRKSDCCGVIVSMVQAGGKLS